MKKEINLAELESYQREAKEDAIPKLARLCQKNRWPVGVVYFALDALLDDLMLQNPDLIRIAEEKDKV